MNAWGWTPSENNVLLHPRHDYPRGPSVRKGAPSKSDRAHSRTSPRSKSAAACRRFRLYRLRPIGRRVNERDRAGNIPKPYHMDCNLRGQFPTRARLNTAPSASSGLCAGGILPAVDLLRSPDELVRSLLDSSCVYFPALFFESSQALLNFQLT